MSAIPPIMHPHIYIGTGGYSDRALLGTLYPHGTAAADFLHHYAQHYDCVEINSSFHAPIGRKSIESMAEKAAGRLKFSFKLHQDFSHSRQADAGRAAAFLEALSPLREHGLLAHLLLQFPHSFERTPLNRRYLADLCAWFEGTPLAVEFRHPSWHTEAVHAAFGARPELIWCNVDYPPHIGYPEFHFQSFQSTACLRLHGRNLRWREAQSAAERHDYRYPDAELAALADTLLQQRHTFQTLFLYFENTTAAHSFHNIPVLKALLAERGFSVKTPCIEAVRQEGLF